MEIAALESRDRGIDVRVERVRVAPGVELAVRRTRAGDVEASGGRPAESPAGRSGDRERRRIAQPAVDRPAPFLLVHGLASNAQMWDGVARVLALRGHEVAAVDLRGHGRSDKPDDGYDFETITDDLRALVEALDLERPVVAGQSWGANLAIEYGHRFPAMTRGIACVDGGLGELAERFPDWDECARVLAPPRLAGTPLADIERYARTVHADWPASGIEGLLANFEVRDDGTVAPWLTYERHMTILRGLWEHRPSERLATLEVPLLLIPAVSEGEDGAERRAALERAERRARRVRVRPFVGADHDVHAQHPEEVAGVLLDALADGSLA